MTSPTTLMTLAMGRPVEAYSFDPGDQKEEDSGVRGGRTQEAEASGPGGAAQVAAER